MRAHTYTHPHYSMATIRCANCAHRAACVMHYAPCIYMQFVQFVQLVVFFFLSLFTSNFSYLPYLYEKSMFKFIWLAEYINIGKGCLNTSYS